MSAAIAMDFPELRSSMRGISLPELNGIAELQTRVDRKYIVEPAVLIELVDSLSPKARILDIEGQRSFDYESVYFDTPGLDLYRAAAYRRRRRYKIRSRTYSNTGMCTFEVKAKNGRGYTVKSRLDYDKGDRNLLTPEALRFVDDSVGYSATSRELVPVLTTRYCRTTIVDPDMRTRLTYDEDLECTDWRRTSVGLGDAVIVETKSSGSPSLSDHWLWANGVRPTKVSKFCTGLAALHPELPANKWHRVLTGSAGWEAIVPARP